MTIINLLNDSGAIAYRAILICAYHKLFDHTSISSEEISSMLY